MGCTLTTEDIAAANSAASSVGSSRHTAPGTGADDEDDAFDLERVSANTSESALSSAEAKMVEESWALICSARNPLYLYLIAERLQQAAAAARAQLSGISEGQSLGAADQAGARLELAGASGASGSGASGTPSNDTKSSQQKPSCSSSGPPVAVPAANANSGPQPPAGSAGAAALGAAGEYGSAAIATTIRAAPIVAVGIPDGPTAGVASGSARRAHGPASVSANTVAPRSGAGAGAKSTQNNGTLTPMSRTAAAAAIVGQVLGGFDVRYGTGTAAVHLTMASDAGAAGVAAAASHTRAAGAGASPSASASANALTPIAVFYTLFYHRLFAALPHVKPLFRRSINSQGRMLANVLKFVVARASVPTSDVSFTGALRHLAAVHNGYGVQLRWYDTMGRVLLYTVKSCLCDRYTPELRLAWRRTWMRMMRVIVPVVRAGLRVDQLDAAAAATNFRAWERDGGRASPSTPSPAPAPAPSLAPADAPNGKDQILANTAAAAPTDADEATRPPAAPEPTAANGARCSVASSSFVTADFRDRGVEVDHASANASANAVADGATVPSGAAPKRHAGAGAAADILPPLNGGNGLTLEPAAIELEVSVSHVSLSRPLRPKSNAGKAVRSKPAPATDSGNNSGRGTIGALNASRSATLSSAASKHLRLRSTGGTAAGTATAAGAHAPTLAATGKTLSAAAYAPSASSAVVMSPAGAFGSDAAPSSRGAAHQPVAGSGLQFMSLLIQLPPGQTLPPDVVHTVLAAASSAANAAAASMAATYHLPQPAGVPTRSGEEGSKTTRVNGSTSSVGATAPYSASRSNDYGGGHGYTPDAKGDAQRGVAAIASASALVGR